MCRGSRVLAVAISFERRHDMGLKSVELRTKIEEVRAL
jgi:hypothetical protein